MGKGRGAETDGDGSKLLLLAGLGRTARGTRCRSLGLTALLTVSCSLIVMCEGLKLMIGSRYHDQHLLSCAYELYPSWSGG